MLVMIILLSWILSITFMFLKHPLSFGFVLLFQTIIISLSSGMMNLDYWFSYILFLIMIGGMLVLFIYMTSVASNEKFKFSNKFIIFYTMMLFILLTMFFLDGYFSFLETKNFDFLNQNSQMINLSFHKFMNNPNLMIMIILMMYLLVTLIAIVKITQLKMGPLRQMKF